MPQAGEFLDKAELRALTGKAQVGTQERWLQAQGIPNRRDGARLIVSRFHVRSWLEGREVPRGSGINWAALGDIESGPVKVR